MRYINLVLQGGGVKGIAYAGALQHVSADVKFHTIAGTSAGSVVAALLATGTEPCKLVDVMRTMRFKEFLDAEDTERSQRLARFANVLGQAVRSKSWRHRIWNLRSLPMSLVGKASVPRDLSHLIEAKGMFSSNRLGMWLRHQFGDKTFQDIVCDELRIVAADIGTGQYKVFSKKTDPSMRIADAVLASSSIPGFFKPFRFGDGAYVDGGLLSNFPSFLVERCSYPSVGLKLCAFENSPSLDTLGGYLQSILSTALEAHDRGRQSNHYLSCFEIHVGDISSTNFDLSEKHVNDLVAAGSSVGRSIPWAELARPVPISTFVDARADELLEQTLEGVEELTGTYTSPSEWPHQLGEKLELDYRLQKDWSICVNMKNIYEVTGDRAFRCRRLKLTSIDYDRSFLDRVPVIRTISRANKDKIITIPWRNKDDQKGISVFFDPPIREGDQDRGMEMTIQFPDGLRKLRKDGRDEFPLTLRQQAKIHLVNASLRFRVASSLGKINVTCDDGQCECDGASEEAFEGEVFRVFHFSVKDWSLTNRAQMRFAWQAL